MEQRQERSRVLGVEANPEARKSLRNLLSLTFKGEAVDEAESGAGARDDFTRMERLATLGAMASWIAHEIKNPLVAIKAFMQLLPEQCSCSQRDDQREFSEVATRELHRVEALLDGLMEVGRVSSVVLEPIHLGDLLADAVRLIQAQAARSKVTVIERLTQGCWVEGDRGQLMQLFLNLFTNALEAMPAGGELAVSCWKTEAHGPRVIAEIADTGPGISAQIRRVLFEPFITGKPRGHGLGLAICRAIADVHGAVLRADNAPSDTGTVMVMEFPAARAGEGR